MKITDVLSSLEIKVKVEWGVIGNTNTRRLDFSVKVEAQRTDLDWDALSLMEPYSLEVAYEGDFYGRKDAVNRILRRLAPDSMQSSYITGQKRVGKSSLAKAIESQIVSSSSFENYHVLYLECGEIRHTTGMETLEELGNQLDDFLKYRLPHPNDWAQLRTTRHWRH